MVEAKSSPILIVDDVRLAREGLAHQVKREGYDVRMAGGGQEALDLLSTHKFDLVLLDLMMPEMDGHEVLVRMKSDNELRDIPVVMISGADEMENVIRCIAAGAEDYLPKSVDPVLLRARITSSIERKLWRDRQRAHVDQVVAAMKTVDQGALDIRLEASGDDVYAELYQGFNVMTEGLQDAARILEVAQDLSGEMQLEVLFKRIIAATTQLLDADRSTLYVHDRKTDELWSLVAEGLDTKEIRIPSSEGLAGLAFTDGQVLNVDDPYAHPSFNQEFDERSGYRTESILCMPITTKTGERIGVTQVLNKNDGKFNTKDIARLRAFTSQIAVTLDNAQLFDEVLNVKNYNDSILKSTTNGLVTMDEERRLVTVNDAACSILGQTSDELVSLPVAELFGGSNSWVLDSVDRVEKTGQQDDVINADLLVADDVKKSINLTVVPLIDVNSDNIGSMIMIEDITDEKRVKTTMARYMSKEVADQLLAEGEAGLSGKSQKVSILFSDIRGFTSLAESLDPGHTVSLLNDYFSEMVDVIFGHHGILDKYIGDAIMALFGAPLGGPQDADNAVAVANDMMTALNKLNAERGTRSRAPINIGIGVSTGIVVAGSIGSPKRMEYTVIGDSVNLAARLESANKFYGTKILLSEHTVAELTKYALLREIDLIRVKGKDEPVAVFEALDFQTEESFPNRERTLDAYNIGLARYRDRNWNAAAKSFKEVLGLNPDDRPSAIYLQRCLDFSDQPPPDGWDGVWTMEDK